MNLSLTYDHRLVDGAYAGRSCATCGRRLETLGRGARTEPQLRAALLDCTTPCGAACPRPTCSTSASTARTTRPGSCSARSPPRCRRARSRTPSSCSSTRRRSRSGGAPSDEEVHVPDGADVEVVETDRGGKSTYHGPGQLVCYPILDLNRHGRDVKRYCRDLEEAIIRTLAAFGVEGDADRRPHRRLARAAAAEDRLDRRPPLALDLDARLRAERRSRPGAVHRVDHRLRARRRRVHDDGARARAGRSRSTRCVRRRRRRSPRCSVSISTSFRPTSGAGALAAAAARAARRRAQSAAAGYVPTSQSPTRPAAARGTSCRAGGPGRGVPPRRGRGG